MHDKAEAIAAAVAPHVASTTVIYSNAEEAEEYGTGHWERVPNDFFFGRKFKRALDLFMTATSTSPVDLFMLIQADAVHPDWPKVLTRCLWAFGIPDLGVWCPKVDWSWWTTERVRLGDYGQTGLKMVAQTDGICWAIRREVVERIQRLDYDCNNLGWGVEWAAVAYAYAHNLLVLRDETVIVGHPKGSGYDHTEARRQQDLFLNQLSTQEKIQQALLFRYAARQ